MKHSIALIGNGSIHDHLKIAKLLKRHDFLIAVDGGLLHLDQMGLVPDLLLGDFDSISTDLIQKYQNVPQKKYPTNKDHTDLELAVFEALKHNPWEIVLYGVLEKRTDHSLYNLYLLTRYPNLIKIETELETLFAITHSMTVNSFEGQTTSLLPLGSSAKGVTTKGLKWELQNATLDQNCMSLSNICLGNAFEIEIESGILICCMIKDKGHMGLTGHT